MFLSLFLAGFLAASGSERAEDRLWRLYEKRDFFSLRHDLPAAASADSPWVQFLRAQTDAAFGRYEESSRILRGLLQTGIPGTSPERSIRERLMLNERALFHYRAALSAIAPAMRGASLQNRAALLLALQDVPPEISSVPGPVTLHPDRFGAVQVSVNGVALRLGIDTAANFSVLSRSAAHQVGLQFKPAVYRVRLASGRSVDAGVAVSQLRLGQSVRLSNVVFLVLPDSALRIGGHRTINGLIGLPELSQLGDVLFRADGTVVLNAARAAQTIRAVALIEGDPVVRAMRGAERILCRIDTGSNRTTIYGSLRRRMPVMLTIGTRKIRLRHPLLLPRANQPYVNCSLGRDALRQLEPYSLDLHTMQLGLN